VPFERLSELKQIIEQRRRWRTIDAQWRISRAFFLPRDDLQGEHGRRATLPSLPRNKNLIFHRDELLYQP